MKNLKGIKTMLKGNEQIKAFEEARKIEKQAIKKGFEDSCRSGKALVEVDNYISSKAFKDGLSKREAKMTKKEFVKEILGMSFGGYTEYIKIGKATNPQRDNFLKGCNALEKEGKSVARSIKNFCKYLSDVAKNDGSEDGSDNNPPVHEKEKSNGIFQLKLTLGGVAHDVRVDLTSKGVKTKNDISAILMAMEVFKAQLKGLETPKKAPKKVVVK